MTAINWKSGVSGDWNDGTKWSSSAAPTSSDDATISIAGIYTVSVSNAAVADSLTFDAASSILSEGTLGSLGVVGAFDLQAGTVMLRAPNSFGSVSETGGSLQLYDGAALGSATLTLTSGELAGMATETVGNHLAMGGAGFTIDAASGKTLTVGAGKWNLNTVSTPTIQFGSATRKGTVIWRTPSATIGGGGGYLVNVADGTLKAGDGKFSFLLKNDISTTVAAGAAIDLNGFSTTISTLEGAGKVRNSGTVAAALILNDANFTGVISGDIGVEIATSSYLIGANTYTNGTTVDSGQDLYVFGSLVGAIADNGFVQFLHDSGAITPGVISGSGGLLEDAGGSLALNHANTYSGATELIAGNLFLGAATGFGSGLVNFSNGRLVGGGTETVTNALTIGGEVFDGATTFAAATGKTLTFNSSTMTWDASGSALTLTFGDAADTGTVALGASSIAVNTGNPIHITVAYGTLKAGPNLYGLVQSATDVKVAAGATLDVGGDGLITPNLTCAGSIDNSAGNATLATEDTSSVAGVISGRVNVEVLNGSLTLTGADTYTGDTAIQSGSTLNLGTGGATGSIVGDVIDVGALVIDETGPVTLAGVISNGGSLTQAGAGVTTLSGANTYTGGTTIERGEIVSAKSSALGNGGGITLTGGELLAGATQTLTHDLDTAGQVKIAAAAGDNLTLDTANAVFNAGRIFFGEGANTGTVVLKVSSDLIVADGDHTTVEVGAGVLKAGDDNLGELLDQIAGTRIDSGATVDAAGHDLTIENLTGPGGVTNTGGVTGLFLFGTSSLSGVISGKWSEVNIFGTAVLGGNETFTGTANIEGGNVTLSGLFGEAVDFASGGILVLTTPSRFTGQVQGFGSGAAIDLRNITTGAGAILSYDAGAGVLTVGDGTHSDKLTFAGSYVLGNFAATADGSGGTEISWRTPPPMAARPAPLAAAMSSFGGAPAAAAAVAAHAPASVHPLLLAVR